MTRNRTSVAPLPMRDGVAPSRVFLPKGPWQCLGEFLVQRFPHVDPAILQARLAAGQIVDSAGTPQSAQAAYQPGGWLWYYRAVPDEVQLPFDLPVLYRDEHLVAVDKPHFLASTPGGRYLHQTALTRLRQTLHLPELSPMHRLDRETAGVLLFCVNPASRGAYQSLFQNRLVYKEYLAMAPWRPSLSSPLVRRSRLEPRPGHFTMQEVPGTPNSVTAITLLSRHGELGLYRLEPLSGRKHQLRVHMSALGIPICHDRFYPELQPYSDSDDHERPLQLLAETIAFTDPLSGHPRRFTSSRRLALHQ